MLGDRIGFEAIPGFEKIPPGFLQFFERPGKIIGKAQIVAAAHMRLRRFVEFYAGGRIFDASVVFKKIESEAVADFFLFEFG